MIKHLYTILFILGLSLAVSAHNVRIVGDVKVTAREIKDNVATIQFTVEWDNCWRDAYNYDGVYVFLKYKLDAPDETWHHIYLTDECMSINTDYGMLMSNATGTKDLNEGFFIHLNKVFRGTGKAPVTLKWQIGSNTERPLLASNFEAGKVFLTAMAVEMVYVPRGAFRLGDTSSDSTFRNGNMSIPESLDVVSEEYDTFCSSPEDPSHPASFAANRINDRAGGSALTNAWYGNKATGEKSYWWAIDFGIKNGVVTNEQKKIQYIAIESVLGYTPKHWRVVGWPKELGNAGDMRVLYDSKLDDPKGEYGWETSLLRTYPATKAIKLKTTGNFRIYQIIVDEMDGSNRPAIKNIAMSEADIAKICDNSVLINGPQTLMNPKLGLFSKAEPASWDNKFLDEKYPNGYAAFFAMKYEVSQEQYVSFLNKLTRTQQCERTIGEAAIGSISEGDYVFGKEKKKPNNRNGIVFASRGKENEPHVFANNYNRADEFSQKFDGQTLACNFLTPADMLAYADWCGLRPMTEMEYEKLARRPYSFIPLHGEYPWNTLGYDRTGTLLGDGSDQEYLDKGNANAYHGRGINGPVRAGAFAKNTMTQEGGGKSFWGASELGGNLAEIYYNANTEGRLFRGLPDNCHGDGKIANTGNANLPSALWPVQPDAFILKGGSYALTENFMATSRRTFWKGNYTGNINKRDSTVSFRLGRTAPVKTDKAVLTLQNGQNTAAGMVADTIYSDELYIIKGDLPVKPDGGYIVVWYVSENDGTTWDEVATGILNLSLNNLKCINVSEDVLRQYIFRRDIYTRGADILTERVKINVIRRVVGSEAKDTVDVYDYSKGLNLQTGSVASVKWIFEDDYNPEKSIYKEPEYTLRTGKEYQHYFRYDDFNGRKGDLKVKFKIDYNSGRQATEYTVNVHVLPKPDSVVKSDQLKHCGDYILDDRSYAENIYRTIEIGGRCWMAENLRYPVGGSKCYFDDDKNCQKYGRLYNWSQAVLFKEIPEEGTQGACPEGWYVPTNQDWLALNQTGKDIKSSTNEWALSDKAMIGTNKSRFSALPAGGYFYAAANNIATTAGISSRNGFNDLALRGWWWSSGYFDNSSWYGSAKITLSSYVRLDNNNTFVIQSSGTSPSIFAGSDYKHLSPTTSNADALRNMRNNFYFSIRCIKKK